MIGVAYSIKKFTLEYRPTQPWLDLITYLSSAIREQYHKNLQQWYLSDISGAEKGSQDDTYVILHVNSLSQYDVWAYGLE